MSLASSLRSLSEALRVPHTGADGQKYTQMIENDSNPTPLSNEQIQQAVDNLSASSDDPQTFHDSYSRLQQRGPRVANITNKLLAVADHVSRQKALRALITTSTATTKSNKSSISNSATANNSNTTNTINNTNNTTTSTPNLRLHRTGSVTVSMGRGNNNNNNNNNSNSNDGTTSSILADISAATGASSSMNESTTLRNTRVTDLNTTTTTTTTQVNQIMSPSTWGKLQGISTTTTSTNDSHFGGRQRESPSALMEELNRVNLGRAPERNKNQDLMNSTASPSDRRYATQQRTEATGISRIGRTGRTGRTGRQSGLESSIHGASNFAPPAMMGPTMPGEDENSPVALRFGQKVVLRSAGPGGFLSATGRSMPMVLSEGSLTELTLVNGNFRDDVGTVRYGDVVSFQVRVPSSTISISGVMAASATDGAVCVATALGGTEKWVIVAPSDSVAGSRGAGGAGSAGSNHGSSSSLTTLRSSDPILLRANSLGGRYLDATLQLSDVAPSSDLSWYLVHAHTPYVPSWNRDRPYLTSNYIDRGFTESAVAQLPRNSPTRVRWMKDRSAPLNTFSIQLQENFLIEDLLSAMLGVGGRYVRASHEDTLFSMDVQLVRDADPSVVFLASRILPACGHYVRVATYVESRSQYQYGLTTHALCASMRSLVQEYTILIAQLEHQFRNGRLTLQKLFFYTQPALRTLAALDDVVYAVGYRVGGDLLNVIDRLRSECGGDRKVHALYSYLLSKSTVPTFNMLTRWVHYGDVDDRYNEFMISVNRDQTRADLLEDFNTKYWASRYTVRGEMVPVFLQRAAEKILTTGKYLNVLRGCGVVGEQRLKESRKEWAIMENEKNNTNGTNGSGENKNSNVGKVIGREASDPSESTTATAATAATSTTSTTSTPSATTTTSTTSFTTTTDEEKEWIQKRRLLYDRGERANIDSIERAYHFSSKALLDLLLKDHQLLPRLRSLKHYFLVDQGDFFVHFMDCAEDELRLSTSDISSSRLHILLESSIRQSISENDAYRNDLKCVLLPYTLIQHLELVQQLSGEDAGSSTTGALSSSRFTGMDSIEDTRRKLLLVRRNQQLKGMEAFALDYEIQWPLSIVISRKELTKYQLIFRHLFFCNHVKRQVREYCLWFCFVFCFLFCFSF